MTDMTDVKRFEPYTDEGNREGYGQMEMCEGGDWVRATDYDALAAKIAEVKAERDHWETVAIARQARGLVLAQKLDAAEAALPAVYRLGLVDADGKACYAKCGEPTVSWMASPRHGFERGFLNATEEISAAIRALPTPTAAELMARINEGENK